MVPQAVVARRRLCNRAYRPVGAWEWHGPHRPFGTDYFTVTYLAEEAARRVGGWFFRRYILGVAEFKESSYE